MSLEVRSTERSLSIVSNTDSARLPAAEAQENWQQRNAVENQSTNKTEKFKRQCITWRNVDHVDVALTMLQKCFSIA